MKKLETKSQMIMRLADLSEQCTLYMDEYERLNKENEQLMSDLKHLNDLHNNALNDLEKYQNALEEINL